MFSSKKREEKKPTEQAEKAWTEALLNSIRERSADDPLIGAKVGGKEIFNRLLGGIKDSRGVHIESFLTVLGALAGYSCQACLRALALAQGLPETSPFYFIEAVDGRRYYYGDQLNSVLAGAQLSVWGLTAGAAQQLGLKEFPDLNDIFSHTTQVLGREEFGIPRVPDFHKPREMPLSYLKAIWPVLLPTVKLFCPDPKHWPILFGIAIQQAILLGKEAIEPSLACRIVMESAIPMSKVDFANI